MDENDIDLTGDDEIITTDDSVKQMLGLMGSCLGVFMFTSPFKDVFGSNGIYANKNTNNLATGLFISLPD